VERFAPGGGANRPTRQPAHDLKLESRMNREKRARTGNGAHESGKNIWGGSAGRRFSSRERAENAWGWRLGRRTRSTPELKIAPVPDIAARGRGGTRWLFVAASVK